MRLEEFNSAEEEQAIGLLHTCAPIPAWCRGLAGRRPYVSRQELLDGAAELARQWTDQEVDAALAHHPRIGERASGDDPEAQASRREQSDLSPDERTRLEWFEANREYEWRFDRIFLIRAKGRSSEEMLSRLRERLEHSEAEEAAVRRGELAEIALLRLEECVTQ